MKKKRARKRDYSKNPGRPPDSIVEERTTEMLVVISNRPSVHRSQLHHEFTRRWKCSWKTVDRIVGRAREELRIRLGRSKEIFRSESLAFYEAKTQDPKASVSDQLRARQRIDELLGLDEPKRTEISGPDGDPVEILQQVDPDAVQLLSDEHVHGILDRWHASRSQAGPIIKLGDKNGGAERS